MLPATILDLREDPFMEEITLVVGLVVHQAVHLNWLLGVALEVRHAADQEVMQAEVHRAVTLVALPEVGLAVQEEVDQAAQYKAPSTVELEVQRDMDLVVHNQAVQCVMGLQAQPEVDPVALYTVQLAVQQEAGQEAHHTAGLVVQSGRALQVQ